MRSAAVRRWHGGLLHAAAGGAVLRAGCAQTPPPADPPVQHAWVQQAAKRGWVVRAVAAVSPAEGSATCPLLRWDSGQTVMDLRAPPASVLRRASKAQAAEQATRFDVATCEAPWPAGARRVLVGGFTLDAPHAEVQRIVLVADTGCRLKRGDAAFQACNHAAQWPFAAIARSAAALKPDMDVHLGDLHYRESPCPAGNDGYRGSPWGYGFDTWAADFLTLAAPLLAAAHSRHPLHGLVQPDPPALGASGLDCGLEAARRPRPVRRQKATV
jgi:hypothetical protein